LHYFCGHRELTCQDSIKNILVHRGQKTLALFNRMFTSLPMKRREAAIRNIPTQVSRYDLATAERVVSGFVHIKCRPMRVSWIIGRTSPFE
jgi:hypothetical protein